MRGSSHFIAERVRTVFSDVVMVMMAVFPSACVQGVMAHCCSTPCFFFPTMAVLVLMVTLYTFEKKKNALALVFN